MPRPLLAVLAWWLVAVPVQSGLPFMRDVSNMLPAGSGCSHLSEIVSPSHGEIVTVEHFVLHVRCLAECGVSGAHVKIYLNEVCFLHTYRVIVQATWLMTVPAVHRADFVAMVPSGLSSQSGG